MSAFVENVVYQHAENVCSLWLQRQQAVEEPHYSFADLERLDNRVSANIAGMRIAGQYGSPIVNDLIKAEDEGALFLKALLAIEQNDPSAFQSLLDIAEQIPTGFDELASALAWVEPTQLTGTVQSLLVSDSPLDFRLGLATCSAHGRPIGNYLEKGLSHHNVAVRTRTLRVGADSANKHMARFVSGLSEFETDKERFEAARALAFCGYQKQAAKSLESMALSDSSYASLATDLFVQMGDSQSVKTLLKQLDAIEGRHRDVVRGFGLLGDPIAIDWLISNTDVDKLARLCGGSISMITGVDIAESDLETLDIPGQFVDGNLTDNPDDPNVLLDDDENLPWPDKELLEAWWGSANKFSKGALYLNGIAKDSAGLKHVLINGMQRQRNAASTSLALLDSETAYLDTRLPTSKQKQWMT